MATDAPDKTVRVVVSSYGTEGDSRPLIELATWLRAQGDDVTLLLEADGAAQAKARDLPVESLAGDLRAALDASAARDRSATILRLARTHVADWARATRRAAEDADVVVGSGLAAEAGQVAALAAGRPFVGISMFPVVPTAAFPPPLVPAPVPRRLNRVAHRMLQRGFWRMFGRRLGPVCREWGMALPPLCFDDHPTLCTASPTLLPTPADWPAAARVVGDLRGEPPTDPLTQSLEPRLLDFLHDGPPPVYVGFGSMATPHSDRLRAAIVELAASHRVLFAPGWSGIRIPDGPRLLSIGRVPHDVLFPHVAAAVHHGGAGTVHAAARSGTPQIVVPMGGDQAWWARRAYAAGIATAPLRLARLAGQALADAVQATGALRPPFAAFAAAMAGEDGRAAVRQALHAPSRGASSTAGRVPRRAAAR